MKKSLVLIVAVLFSALSFSQTATFMRVMQADTIVYSEDITQIDSIIFAEEYINGSLPEGALSGEFSVSPTKKIRFSKGNLQFNPAQGTHQCADGTSQQGTWRFAEHQWEIIKTGNDNASASYDGWLDLFSWGTSGYDGKYPYLKNDEYGDSYFINNQQDISGTMLDWGLYNEISNGGTYGTWRTPTAAEYEYLFTQRQNAASLYLSNVRVNGIEGLLLCPDDWDVSNTLHTSYSLSEWEFAEAQGLVFFPYAGVRDYSLIGGTGWFFVGYYWTGTCSNTSGKAICLDTYSEENLANAGHIEHPVSHGRSVRLVQDAIIHDVPSTSGNTAIVHDTIVKVVHDTVYINRCPVEAEEGALIGEFSVSSTTTVHFSQGNLQYVGTWQFAEHQWDYFGSEQSDNHRDLFGWGTGDAPNKVSESYNDYSTFVDWGTNAITNGGNTANQWRTLTRDEWVYLFYIRANAATLFGLGSVNGVNGTILLPDNWTLPAGASFTASTTQGLADQGSYYYYDSNGHFNDNTYTTEQWTVMESAGAVFLPAAGYRWGTDVNVVGSSGGYWSATPDGTGNAYNLYFNSGSLNPQGYGNRDVGFGARLVR